MLELNYNQAAALVQDVLEGNEDPQKAYGLLYTLKANIERCMQEVKPYAIEEAEKYQSREYELFKTEYKNGGRSWDFSGVPEIKQLEETLKGKKKFYQSLFENNQKGIEPVTTDGEILPLPKCKFRDDMIVIKMKK